jgi:hypothetical protein
MRIVASMVLSDVEHTSKIAKGQFPKQHVKLLKSGVGIDRFQKAS